MTKFPAILCSAPVLRGACLAAALAALAGCGQKGPLYLPTDAAAAGRATLPQILLPSGSPSVPTPATGTVSTQPTPPVDERTPMGGTGTGTASPIGTP
jgi:predicted small lipoprotein YifL